MEKKVKVGDFVAIDDKTDEVVAFGETIKEVGEAAREAGVNPEDIFITTVLPEGFTFY